MGHVLTNDVITPLLTRTHLEEEKDASWSSATSVGADTPLGRAASTVASTR
jgi:hypothetical protein